MADVSERELEDWVCLNIEEVCGQGYVHLGRQVHLVSGGIADVMAVRWHPETPDIIDLCIVELKADTIDGSAVVQLLTYMGAVQAYGRVVRRMLGGARLLVRGVVAAPFITDAALYAVRASPHVSYTSLTGYRVEDTDSAPSIYALSDYDALVAPEPVSQMATLKLCKRISRVVQRQCCKVDV